MAGMDNIALWHERDITHSSVERVIIPDSTTLLHYMLYKLNNVLTNLVINTKNMKRNLELTKGLVFSQRVLLALTAKMETREAAYKEVQTLAMRSWDKKLDFKKLVKTSKTVKKYLKSKEIDSLFDISYYTHRASEIIKRAIS